MKPPCLMLKQLSYFVGRENTLAIIEQALKDKGFLYLDVLEGVEGMGKTTLLVKLYADLKELKEFYPVWSCMTVFNPVRKGERADPDSTAALANNLDDYRQLLTELAGEFSSEAFADFNAWVENLFKTTLAEIIRRELKVDFNGTAIKTGDIHVGAFGRLADGEFKTGDVVVKVSDRDLDLAIDHLKNSLTAEFIQRARKIEKDFRCVLLLDNFQLMIDQNVGRWFLSGVAAKLDNTVVVLAKTKTTAHLDLKDSVTIALDNFSLNDVQTYLEKRLELKKFPEKLAVAIYEYTGGHPQAVVLAVDVCESLSETGTAGKDILEVFDQVPAEHAAKIAKLVEKIKESIADPVVKKALEIGWVLRRFDADVLRCLLTDPETPAADLKKYEEIITALEEYSFTENHDGFYKFHDFIRQAMEQRLKKNQPQRYQDIHRKAAEYYGEKLIEYDKARKDESSYLRWFRYESHDWQVLIAEWLFHLQQTPQRDQARLMFLKIYFDAFWWWGFYEPFPFCERLLSEWRKSRMAEADREWFALVQLFHDSFPTGYQKQGRGNWPQVETALSALRRLCRLENPPATLDPGRRHLKGITDIFLSQALFYQNPEHPQAEIHLQEALKIFEEDGDEWNHSWTLFHLAELYRNRRRYAESLELCRRALVWMLKAPEAERDYEMLAGIHRIAADIDWENKEIEKSFRNYVRAVAAAYLYHGLPSPADLYTRNFQREMMERTTGRLQAFLETGKNDELRQAAQIISKFFLPYRKLIGQTADFDPQAVEEFLRNKPREEWAEFLFPPLPGDEELNRRETQYVDRVRRSARDLAFQVEEIE